MEAGEERTRMGLVGPKSKAEYGGGAVSTCKEGKSSLVESVMTGWSLGTIS